MSGNAALNAMIRRADTGSTKRSNSSAKKASACRCKRSNLMDDNEKQTVRILYTNYRGETAIRQIVPQRVWFGATEWHTDEQWLLDAIDVEKDAVRAFAMKDIRAWF
jgi:hypothetical protein